MKKLQLAQLVLFTLALFTGAAYLSTACGPSSYGIQRTTISVPLATGTMAHEIREVYE